ncbi:hypothetical protein DH2020_042261 [Rehmannia glutinosa]|uniref:Xyloglucan endotransglucosylase/hydrolase n=1 Tax=Rehmannia glutinosa TaxID=99300 RepID=A0ABR0UMV5_REHGL
MERRAHLFAAIFFTTFVLSVFIQFSEAAESKGSFDDNFSKSCPETNFKTSEDGQIWYLSLDEQAGCGFMTKQRYRFGWFSMKLKLVGGDSAGVVTAYYMCSENAAGPERDELDIEFLGNRTGQPYLIQTNVYKNGTGGQANVLILEHLERRRLGHKGRPGEDGLEKAPFVSSYKDFNVEACQWEDPFPACVSTTTDNWWDQYNAWHLSDDQKKDYAWVQRNLVIYDYCKDTERYPKLPEECWLSPWA